MIRNHSKYKKNRQKYRFEVSDHGPGISQEELPHVWDRYYKTSTNYVRPTEGSGLGLSIVKRNSYSSPYKLWGYQQTGKRNDILV